MAEERKGGAGAAAAAAYLRASADDRKAASAGVAGNKKVILKSADMKEEMQKEAIDCALAVRSSLLFLSFSFLFFPL